MKRLVLISLLACASVCFAFTNASAPATYSRTVAGTVYDSQDLTPLGGIEISEIVAGKVMQTTKTDGDGHFSLTATQSRTMITFSDPSGDYQSSTMSFDMNEEDCSALSVPLALN